MLHPCTFKTNLVHTRNPCKPNLPPSANLPLSHTRTHPHPPTHTLRTPHPVRSLGCALYELTAQRPAFNAFNIHGLVTKIRRHRMAPLPPGYSAEWGGLVAL